MIFVMARYGRGGKLQEIKGKYIGCVKETLPLGHPETVTVNQSKQLISSPHGDTVLQCKVVIIM